MPLMWLPSPPVVRIQALPAFAARMRSPDGPTVRIAAELRNETLFVSLKGETPERLRDLVARAVRAEWVRDGANLILQRGNALRKALLAEERAEVLRATQASRESLAAQVAAMPGEPAGATRAAGDPAAWTPETRARIEALSPPLRGVWRAAPPDERLGFRLMGAMGAEPLALVPTGRVARYASHPGRRVPGLGFDPGPMLARYRDEAREVLESGGAGAEFLKKLPLGARVGIKVEDLGSALYVQPYAWAPGGEPTPFSGWVLYYEPADDARWPGSERWPSSAKEAERASRGLDPALDPLECIAGEGVRAAAAASAAAGQEEVVLALPDEAAQALSSATAPRAAEGLRTYLRFSREGGALVGSSRRPLRTTAERMPRALAPGLIALLGRASTATLLEVAAYAEGAGPGPARVELEHWLFNRAGTNDTALSALGSSRGILRAYAAMPPRAREAWLGGRVFRLGEFSPAIREAIEAYVDANSGKELRFAFPDGLPPETALAAWNRSAARLEIVGGGLGGKVTSPGNVGYSLKRQRAGESWGEENGYEIVREVRYRPLGSTIIQIALAVDGRVPGERLPGEGLELRATLHENRATGEAPARWDALPASFADEIRKAGG